MSDDEMMKILERAAATIGEGVDIFPAGVQHIEIREDGWCDVGWLNCQRLEKTYDVWWNPELRHGCLWPWQYVNLRWSSRAFPMQSTKR